MRGCKQLFGIRAVSLFEARLKEYWVSDRTPLSVEIKPFPFLRSPFQTADALRFIFEHSWMLGAGARQAWIPHAPHPCPRCRAPFGLTAGEFVTERPIIAMICISETSRFRLEPSADGNGDVS
jgi:hypothetical protein